MGGKNEGGKRGRGSETKTPVFGMAERGGDVITIPVERTNSRTLLSLIHKNISENSTIMTDEFAVYNNLNRHYTAYA